MENELDRLMDDHARLRRCLEAMAALLGEARGVGWEDKADVDLRRFRALEQELTALLRAHERREETRLPEGALKGEHRTLNELFQLLQSVASLCDGRHVYALRSVLSTAAGLLERHLAYEERELFPSLRERGERLRRHL